MSDIEDNEETSFDIVLRHHLDLTSRDTRLWCKISDCKKELSSLQKDVQIAQNCLRQLSINKKKQNVLSGPSRIFALKQIIRRNVQEINKLENIQIPEYQNARKELIEKRKKVMNQLTYLLESYTGRTATSWFCCIY